MVMVTRTCNPSTGEAEQSLQLGLLAEFQTKKKSVHKKPKTFKKQTKKKKGGRCLRNET